MSDNDQKKIIQEQAQANQRIIQAVEQQQEGTFQHQAPVNERIKQMGPNERIQAKPQNTIPKVKQTKTKTNKKGDIMSYNKIKQYAGVLLLAIGFIYAGLELVDRQPVQSVMVGILAFLLVETALQSKSK